MMKITAKPLAIVILVIVFGSIAVSSAMGLWYTETTKVPVTYTTGEFAGQYNPADIRGSYTFDDVSTLFDVPLEDLRAAFDFPAGQDIAELKVKDLEALYADSPGEIGTEFVREFVALYHGLPIVLSEDTYFPAAAVAILKQRAALSPEQIAFLDEHIADGAPAADGEEQTPEPVVQAEEPSQDPTPAPTEHAPPDRMVRGKTTFRELLDWGISQEAIERVLGVPMGDPATTVKDYCSAQGLEFEAIKTALQVQVDAMP